VYHLLISFLILLLITFMILQEDINIRFFCLLAFTILFAIYNVAHAGSMKLILEKASFKRR